MSTTYELTAEYRLCNAIYLNPNLLDDENYSRDLFIHEIPKDFCDAIDEMTRVGTPLNELSIFQEVSKRNMNVTLDEVKTIININDQPVNFIKDITETLKDAHKKYNALDYLEKCKKILSSPTNLTDIEREKLKSSFENMESSIFSLQDNSISKALTMKEWGDKWNEEAKQRRHGKRFYFNDPILDEMVVDGPSPGTCGLFVAQSGMGKTTVVTHLYNGFLNAGIPCGFFSLEMGAIATYDRILSSRLQVPYREIVNPPDEETFDSIYNMAQQEKINLDQMVNTFFCEDANLSLNDIKKKIVKFQEKIGQKYCIIIIDLITMVREFSDGESMAQKIEVAINKLSALAKELGCHFICTAQLRRDGESASISDPEDVERFRPRRDQIKNSGSLLERCRYTIGLFRKKFYINQYFGDDPEVLESFNDEIELSILKQNDGECSRKKYAFNGECFTITPLLDTDKTDDD